MTKLLDFTQPHVLRDEAEYNKAVQEIDSLLDADPPKESADYERLEFLSVLVEEEAVDFMLKQKGLERSDLADWLGGRSRVSEFFSKKRELSMGQVEALRKHLGLSADLSLK